MNEVTLRLDATWHLTVAAGDTVRRGQKMNESPQTNESCRAPVSGTIESIQFDPAHHEFVIVMTPAS